MKETFIAWLALARGDASAVVARLEYHGDEPGWHCHGMCCPVHEVPVGVVKPYGCVRMPSARKFHRRTEFKITQASALERSFGFFRVGGITEGAML